MGAHRIQANVVVGQVWSIVMQVITLLIFPSLMMCSLRPIIGANATVHAISPYFMISETVVDHITPSIS